MNVLYKTCYWSKCRCQRFGRFFSSFEILFLGFCFHGIFWLEFPATKVSYKMPDDLDYILGLQRPLSSLVLWNFAQITWQRLQGIQKTLLEALTRADSNWKHLMFMLAPTTIGRSWFILALKRLFPSLSKSNWAWIHLQTVQIIPKNCNFWLISTQSQNTKLRCLRYTAAEARVTRYFFGIFSSQKLKVFKTLLYGKI